jgi:hypothetical protein
MALNTMPFTQNFMKISRFNVCLQMLTSIVLDEYHCEEQYHEKAPGEHKPRMKFGVKQTIHIHLVPRLNMQGAIPPLSQTSQWCDA